jgi:signal transduction histidine kinase
LKPVLIGSNLHIYCGAAEIKTIRSTRSSMAIELTDAGARAGDLFVYSHYLPVLGSASGLVVTDIDQAGENVWRIRMRDREHGAAQRIELSILLPVTRQWWFWSLIALAAAGFLTTIWRYVISLRLERRLALDQERSRISRDLHDGMGADLTQIALIAEMAARQPGLVPAAREQLDRIVASTHSLASELDSVVWATNPGNDTLEHLVQYLGNYAQVFLEAADLRLRLDVPPQLPDLAVGSATRHNLFLAAKEALHNVVRHAGAACVNLRVRIQDHTLVVEVEDDGRGLAARAAAEPGADGLPNMANRMAQVQGRCETLPGKDGRGTLVRFSLPLRELDSPSQS